MCIFFFFQGQNITDPFRKISKKSSEDFQFNAVPKYLPESESSAALVQIAGKPEITVKIYRKLLLDSELEVSSHVLSWIAVTGAEEDSGNGRSLGRSISRLSHPLHQENIDQNAKLSDLVQLTMSNDEVKKVFADRKERRKTMSDLASAYISKPNYE